MVGKNLDILPPYWTIGKGEHTNVKKAMMKGPLSGYIGGSLYGGHWVERLAREWRAVFSIEHAICCNSATSGLLAACVAAGIKQGDEVWVTALSMSATAACALHLGAKLTCIDIEPTFDIEPTTYCIDPEAIVVRALGGRPKALIVTNLFGHPARLLWLRKWCDENRVIMIEDNAQAPYAKENNRYAGTIGHLGVFSLNVHKHLQCGEGGIVVTPFDNLARRVRLFVNHAELSDSTMVGLNLRMTEPIAAIACAQLKRGAELVQTRIELAEAITECFADCPFVQPPTTRDGCTHVFYMWVGKLALPTAPSRAAFVDALRRRNIPVKLGYAKPLHQLFHTRDHCPEADKVSDSVITFETCAYSPHRAHLEVMRDIIREETDRFGGDHDDAVGLVPSAYT